MNMLFFAKWNWMIVVLTCCIMTPAYARYISGNASPCAYPFVRSYSVTQLYQDDATHQYFTVVHNCDGTDNISCNFSVSTGLTLAPNSIATPISYPAAFASQIQYSNWSIPGGDIGAYCYDSNGVEIGFRAPINSTEEAELWAMYGNEFSDLFESHN